MVELDPCPGIEGGLANLGVCERLEPDCGRISAGGARAFEIWEGRVGAVAEWLRQKDS
jgi:hypothetical protein